VKTFAAARDGRGKRVHSGPPFGRRVEFGRVWLRHCRREKTKRRKQLFSFLSLHPFNFIHIVKVILLLLAYSCLPPRMLVFLREDNCVVASQFDIDLCLSFVIAFPVIFSAKPFDIRLLRK